MPEIWIQIENRPWDVCPKGIDRMTNKAFSSVPMTITSPETPPVTKSRPIFQPLSGNALISRRYKPPTKPDKSDVWTIPDDHKGNPWDLNEPDPTDSGTMGTIPAPVIECNLDASGRKTGDLIWQSASVPR